MALTIEQLKEVMKYYLKGYNDENVILDGNTIHNTVLSENDGIGNLNSKVLYQQDVCFSMLRNGHPFKRWPDDWMDKSVDQLANEIY